MDNVLFFIGFFVLIVFLGMSGSKGHGIFSNTATTSTIASQNQTHTTISSAKSRNSTTTSSPQPATRLSPKAMEQKIASLYKQLNQLSETVRKQKLREPISPYAGTVELRTGNVRDTNPAREYLMLHALNSNTAPVNISHWYVTSYVTGESMAIPQGDRLLARVSQPQESDIMLNPGEKAYLITGRSPLETSFHENLCTGYLRKHITFYPSLSLSCPSPMAEMKRFATVPLNDDSCYSFMNHVGSCNVIDYDTSGVSRFSSGCQNFLANTFNHDSCILKHRFDPYFDANGYWHVYLGSPTELWRSQREILRLMDENDTVISVLEY